MKSSSISESAQPNFHLATPRQLELLQLPPLSSYLPHQFASTGFHIESLDCRCSVCDTVISNDEVRGIVSNLLPDVMDIDVIGKCPCCGIHTPFRIRIRSNRIYEWQDEHGQWHQSKIYEADWSGLRSVLADFVGLVRTFLG